MIEEDIVRANETNFLKCFENLLLGYAEGNHLLYIKPKIVDLIKDKYLNIMDSRMESQFIYYEENSMIESKIAFNLVNYAIKIVPETIKEEVIQYDTHKIGYLHADNFLTSATIQKTILLGENPNDGDIYKIFAQEYIEKSDSNLKIKLKIENGGGNTISPTFIKKIEERDDLCLCMLDSDKKYPSSTALGETANRVIRETNRIDMTPKVDFYIEERVRELENMLPMEFYYTQYSKDTNKTSIFENFKELEKIDSKLIYFFDMKKGLKHFDIRMYPDWSNLIKSRFLDEDSPTCTRTSCCPKKEECKCTLIKPIGNKVLVDFINFYKTKKTKIMSSLDEFMKVIWYDIGKLVFSWGCGQEPILANT